MAHSGAGTGGDSMRHSLIDLTDFLNLSDQKSDENGMRW
jgi:hypothetical protein